MNCELEFVREEGAKFRHRCVNCGVEIVSRYRDPARRKQPCGKIPPRGVGDEMFALLSEHGAKMASQCDCAAIRRQMNQLGPDGCRAKSVKLVKLVAAGWSLPDGVTLAGLLDHAVARASQSARGPTTH